MALPVVLHQDPPEVRVAHDPDAHHVPGLALVPVGGRPDLHDARDRLVLVEPSLDAHAAAARDAQQVVVHREALRLPLREAPPGPPGRAGWIPAPPRSPLARASPPPPTPGVPR